MLNCLRIRDIKMALDQTLVKINSLLNEIHELNPQQIIEGINDTVSALRKDTVDMRLLEKTLENEVKTRQDNEEAMSLLEKTRVTISDANAELQKYQSILQYLSTFRSKIKNDMETSLPTADSSSMVTLLNY